MKQYRATIIGDRYPLDFTVEASDWPAAAQRLTKKWKQRFKGSRTNTLTLKIVKIDSNPYI